MRKNINKRFLFMIIILTMILLPINTKANGIVYKIKDLKFSINFDGWNIVQKGNLNNINLEDEELEQAKKIFNNYGYLYGYKDDKEIQIFIANSNSSNDLRNLDDDLLKTLENKVSNSYNSISHKIYKNANYIFFYIEHNNSESYKIDYFTIINNNEYTIRFQKYNRFTNNDKSNIKSIIDNISFIDIENEYNIYDLSIKLYDKDWQVYKKENIENPKNEEEEKLLQYFIKNDINIMAINYTEDKSINISAKNSEAINDLKKQNKKELDIYAKNLINNKATNYKIYENTNNKYICFEYFDDIDNSHTINYTTIVNNKSYTIKFRQFKKFTNIDREKIKKQIDKITYNSKETTTANDKTNYCIIMTIIFTITFICLILIFLTFKRKSNKQKKIVKFKLI